MLLLYRIVLHVYAFGIALVSPFREKARKFRAGRKKLSQRLFDDMQGRKEKLIWIHAASLGEFEQGRPIIEEVKKWKTEVKILLTFFSPSGYEVRKHYPLADYVYYLPLDIGTNAQRFVATVKPDLVIFIKYELWYGYLMALHRSNIPVLLVSAIFRPGQVYFKPYGRFFRKALRQIYHFYVQNEASAELLKSIDAHQYTVAGDTRFDRVVAVAEERKKSELLEKFKSGEKVMVLGSIWRSDMIVLDQFISDRANKFKFIIAPHNVSDPEINELLRLPKSIALSQAEAKNIAEYRVLIIDSIGLLSSAYGYGEFVFVGGGFHGGLHNTLEAAVYGIPVFFGKHKNNCKFAEAAELVKCGGGFEVANLAALEAGFDQLVKDKDAYSRACDAAKSYVYSHAGATMQVMSGIQNYLSIKR